ncbi:hypothetical protein L580_1669 [Serratia fonticola AU-P3(3)]|jgi:hypothetical protein|nr:hypothetical protein L580_1669 [Serratia fonticola AU-P3(3)]ERK10871.1 hypothetical protein L581_4232 [Serratia fonticola AU-AP2C]
MRIIAENSGRNACGKMQNGVVFFAAFKSTEEKLCLAH